MPVAAAAVVLGQLVSCTVPVTGTGRAPWDVDPGKVVGKPITNGPSGPRSASIDAGGLVAENADNGEIDQLALAALADVYEYWTVDMRRNFQQEFRPLRKLLSYDANGKNVKICGSATQGKPNAFYCDPENTIAWDRGELLPELRDQYGKMAVVSVLAHEMGHAIQYQLGKKNNIERSTPSILKEQQADCYTGAYMRWVLDGQSKRFQLSTGDGLNQVLATMFSIRDPLGEDFTRRGAHGLAFDRVYAFQAGLSEGTTRCARMDMREIAARVTEKKFTEEDLNKPKDQRGNEPIDDKTLRLLKISLDEAFKPNGVKSPEVKDGAQCQGAKTTAPAAYCEAENVVAIDRAKLSEMAKPLKRGAPPGESGNGFGDFAAFAEVASRYTLAVQKGVGKALTGTDAGLRTACLTGAWAKVTENEHPANPDNDLRLSPGDLDEAVGELLHGNSLIGADRDGAAVPSGFARVEAFRLGYERGSKECATQFG
ncbi:neutral zinc metallopeptidase [Herbihabitans rhizosphaerae]|uniref:neutral zinc metallopeptidase n=1 Tax=Herbihabitans rhizosphaerae TaxID=1872711 RepID=UPI001F5F0A17|nr:neutral zinc metallopeptidase [Herbihabitans rhizosphaerae]